MDKYSNFTENNQKTGKEEKYLAKYEKKALTGNLQEYPHVKELLEKYGGYIFDKGLFRFHTLGSSAFWTEITSSYFTSHKDLFYCFGFDWMGRQFACNKADTISYMFDPATGKAFVLKQTIAGFLNEDLVDYRDDTLGVETFESLEDLLKGRNLEHDQCLGFKKLLFLGGVDELENYERVDMEVYWELNYQVYCKVQSLPEGQLINKISF